jgi:hypothetical protein
VHLLLAFPLFVVVVGVDARWISHSLEKAYPHLKGEGEKQLPCCLERDLSRTQSLDLQGQGNVRSADDLFDFGRDATPHDYLEKIFQIPIWLRPIGEQGSRQMLDGLLEGRVVPAAPGQGGASESEQEPAKAGPMVRDPTHPPSQPTTAEGGAPGTPTGESNEPSDASSPTAEPPLIDLTPDSLEILSTELEFMKELAPLIGRSPRAIKRFVNLYRLVKATLDQTHHPLVVEERALVGDHRAVLFMLAVVTGLPDLSRRFFETIRRGETLNEEQHKSGEPSEHNLSWVLNNLGMLQTGAAEADRKRLADWLDTYREQAWLTAPLRYFAGRAAQVSRYSFRVEQR